MLKCFKIMNYICLKCCLKYLDLLLLINTRSLQMTKQEQWLLKNCDSLKNTTTILTGATGILGEQIARYILLLGGNLILAIRNIEKGEKLKNRLKNEFNNANIFILILDVSSFLSINNFLKELSQKKIKVNYLINNAGIFTAIDKTSKDGYEMRYISNFLGPIYLTYKLIEQIDESEKLKVVFQSSLSATFIKIHWQDIQRKSTKDNIKAYSNSKRLINLASVAIQSAKSQNASLIIAHPGIVNTRIIHYENGFPKWLYPLASGFLNLFCHKAKTGALGVVYALNKNIIFGDYIVPRGLFHIWGKPKKVKVPQYFFDKNQQEKIKLLINEELKKGESF